MKKHWQWTLAMVTIFAMLLSACAAQPTPAPTPVPSTAAPAEPTAAPQPTEAPKPTEAPQPTAVPTEVPAPTAAPTEAPAAAWAAPAGALVSVAADAAPTLDGKGDDAAWAAAPETVIPVAGGANNGSTEIALKSVYSGDTVYYLATWADPTESFIRSPWEKQADGSWKVLKDPNDKGGDNNLIYEDKLAFIWDIGGSIKGFEAGGCMGLCHAGENPDKKPYGNKYTATKGEIGDIWHWKSVRNLGQIDDQFVDDTRYSADTPEAGRKSDKKDSGGYVNNETEDKKLPKFMAAKGGTKDGAPGYILDAEKVAFDDTLFKAGDKLPGIVKSAIVGDRGDITAGWQWVDGKWTLEFSRKLVTGSPTDVQFDNMDGTYYLGLAAFDNAQVRHSFQAGATPFVFAPEGVAMAVEAAKPALAAPEGALVSAKADAAPKLDGVADDAVWAAATEVVIPVAGGANNGSTEIALKSVYSGDMVYYLATWADPTESFIRSPWEKQADGSWKVLKDPNDKGGDNNLIYEDKLAFIWDIGGSIKGFEAGGCMGLCHAGENSDKKPYGNKYTATKGEIGDIWHWKSVRNLGQIDDQFVDDTRYSADTPEAGRKSDKKESGGYVNNETEDKKLPKFMAAKGGSKDGAPGYILDAEKVAFDDTLFKAGDKLPGIVKSAIVGDRGDITAGWKWADGKWTLEFGRKLVTGSPTDVQFDKLDGTYHLAVAAFDNAQVRHAFQAGATPFVFEQ